MREPSLWDEVLDNLVLLRCVFVGFDFVVVDEGMG